LICCAIFKNCLSNVLSMFATLCNRYCENRLNNVFKAKIVSLINQRLDWHDFGTLAIVVINKRDLIKLTILS